MIHVTLLGRKTGGRQCCSLVGLGNPST
jgi:hypothetical protein